MPFVIYQKTDYLIQSDFSGVRRFLRDRDVFHREWRGIVFLGRAGLALLLGLTAGFGARAADVDSPAANVRHFFIGAYRVDGVYTLTPLEIETAVYPFLGPDRTAADVEAARAAVEKAYQAHGYPTVAVQIPQQRVDNGVVVLLVTEGRVGRLRVRGSRYHSLDEIKKKVPSLTEGTVPNFKAVQEDLVALNQLPDRQVTPTMRPGVAAGTVDVDLNVKDSLPLHGSVEINNRRSPDTKPLRVSASVRYDNLWQREDSFGFSYLVAPQRAQDAAVYSAYYLTRLKNVNWLSLMINAVKQDSDVNTLGTIDVAGRGEVVGLRAMVSLPGEKDFFQSLNGGLDYKHFDTALAMSSTSTVRTPITYYPITTLYSATWLGQGGSATQMDAGVTFHVRGLGSGPTEFANKRSGADGSFIYFRGDLSRTQALPADFELFGQIQWQLSGQPLVNNEQMSGGGVGTVRGYLESEVTGDDGVFGTLEMRLPSMTLGGWLDEWRFHVFTDAGALTLHEALPEQQSRFALASAGIGAQVKFKRHFNGSLDGAVPLIRTSSTPLWDTRFTFRLWSDF